jgi:hypothetical protein
VRLLLSASLAALASPFLIACLKQTKPILWCEESIKNQLRLEEVTRKVWWWCPRAPINSHEHLHQTSRQNGWQRKSGTNIVNHTTDPSRCVRMQALHTRTALYGTASHRTAVCTTCKRAVKEIVG